MTDKINHITKKKLVHIWLSILVSVQVNCGPCTIPYKVNAMVSEEMTEIN